MDKKECLKKSIKDGLDVALNALVAIAENHAKLEEIEKKSDKPEWPKVGDEYWYIIQNDQYENTEWFNDIFDQERLKCGNVYKTEKDCKKWGDHFIAQRKLAGIAEDLNDKVERTMDKFWSEEYWELSIDDRFVEPIYGKIEHYGDRRFCNIASRFYKNVKLKDVLKLMAVESLRAYFMLDAE